MYVLNIFKLFFVCFSFNYSFFFFFFSQKITLFNPQTLFSALCFFYENFESRPLLNA